MYLNKVTDVKYRNIIYISSLIPDEQECNLLVVNIYICLYIVCSS